MGLRLHGEGCHLLAFPIAEDGRLNLEDHAWIKSSGTNSGVSNSRVDFVLNAVQELADSPKEVLKQAMLRHEVLFRNQVLELHRLYWIQKNLMNDLYWRDFGKNAVSTDNLTPSRFTEMDFRLVDSPVRRKLNSTLAQSGRIFQECTVHRTWGEIFNLHLPVEEHIKRTNTECLEIQNPLHYKARSDSDSEELQLTLGNRKQGNSERKDAGRTLYVNDSCIALKDAFDLEVFATFMSNEDVNVISSRSCQSHFSDSACIPSMHHPALPCMTFTGRRRKDAIHRSFDYHPNADQGESSPETSSLHLDCGWREFGDCFPTYIDNQEPKPTSHNLRSFDLNLEQFESFPEISQYEVNLPPSASSPTIPSGILEGPQPKSVSTPASFRESSNKSVETSDVLQTSGRSSSMHSQPKESTIFTHDYGLHICGRQTSTEKTELAWNRTLEGNKLVTWRSNSGYIADTHGNKKEGISGSFNGSSLASADELPHLSPSGLYQLSNVDAEKSIAFPVCYIHSERKNTKASSIVNEKGCSLNPSIENSIMPQETSTCSELGKSNCDKQSNSQKSEKDAKSSRQCGDLMSVEGAISVPLEELQDEHWGVDPIGKNAGLAERKKACGRTITEIEGHSVNTVSGNIQTNEISPVVIEKYSGKQEVIAESDNPVALLEKSCCSSESTDKILDEKENDTAEMDCPILRTAETLIHISSQNTASTSDEVAKVGQMSQNSSDSFESMVLMLTETVTDEYSMLATLPEEETGKGKCRFMLRKGRGLRDFQRDVLPGLVSLSRHEIFEDLHTIAEAVRLHELTYGSKKLSRGHWLTTPRTRRSRLSYFGKKQ